MTHQHPRIYVRFVAETQKDSSEACVYGLHMKCSILGFSSADGRLIAPYCLSLRYMCVVKGVPQYSCAAYVFYSGVGSDACLTTPINILEVVYPGTRPRAV